MRRFRIFSVSTCILSATFLSACHKTTESQGLLEERNDMNAWAVDNYTNEMIANAAIAQHTLYPYHFIDNSAELNDVGHEELAILVKHFREHPGKLNMAGSRGVVKELHKARIQTVRDILTNAGVDAKRIQIADEAPGGQGMPTENVVVILEKKGLTADPSTGTPSTTR
jgi:hypothetical protein